jgi:maleylpyruvate isomerase
MSARVDQVTDPRIREDLLIARRGQAYFARHVKNLDDADFDTPSLVDGWTRAELVAYVALSARALTRVTEYAREEPVERYWATLEHRHADVAFTATLPPEAIRYLSDHAAVHLTVEWRDLTDDQWTRPLDIHGARPITASATPRIRAAQVWLGAVALGSGGRLGDIPRDAVEVILDGRSAALEVPATPDEWA